MRSRTLVIFLCALTAAQACSPDRASDPNVEALAAAAKSPAKSRPNYDWMGQFHNEALDFALVKINGSKKTSKADKCTVGLAAVKEFSRSFQRPGGAHLRVDPDVIDGLCDAFSAGTLSPGVSAFLAPTTTISPVAEGYMNQIVNAIDYASSTSGYAATVAQLANAAAGALGDGTLEAGAVYGTGSISVSSNDYWASNSGSWGDGGTQASVKLAGPTSPSFQVSAKTKRLAKIDAAAAISVLMREWWMGELALEKACFTAAAASMIAALIQT